MRPEFPAGSATKSALYTLGLLAALKALSLVLMGQAAASVLAGLLAQDPAWSQQLVWGFGGVLLRSLTTWAQSAAARRAALGVKEQLRSELLAHALGGGAGTGGGSAGGAGTTGGREAGSSDGGLVVLATRGLDALDSYYTQFLPALINCAVIPLLLGARILLADWVSAVVIVLTVPLVPVFMVLIGRYTEDRVSRAQKVLARLSGHMLELAKGLPVLVGLGRARAQRRALEEISEEYRSRTMATLRTAFLSALALELIATISVAVVAVFIGVRLVHGDMPLEAGLLALILAPDCYLPLRELGTAHHASDDGRAALAETRRVMDAPGSTRIAAAGREGGAAGPPDVTVSGITVTYGGRTGAAVGPLTFDAPAGQITALDGASGAGKSTILAVLAGIAGTGNGTTVSGSVTGFGPADVAWVPQHPVMVAPSVKEEVLLYLTGHPQAAAGFPGESADDVAERCLLAVAAAHLADKQTAELSPGELRRVALARALARIEAGATLLLLDEPTAHLDAETAAVVNSTILGLRGQVTVVLVAHDPRTRQLADSVIPVAVGPAAALAGVSCGAAVQSAPGAAPAATSSADLPQTRGTSSPQRIAGNGSRHSLGRLGRLLAPEALRFGAAGAVGVLAALFAVALAGLSGWLIIRASEQPPILYLLTAIVGVRFFGIGRAVLRYGERLLLHDAVFAALTVLRGRLWGSLSRRALAVRRLLQGGQVLGTVIDDVDTVRDLLPRVVLPPITAVVVAAGSVTATVLLLPAAVPVTVGAALVSLLVSPAAALAADRMSSRTEQRLRSSVLHYVAAALDARADLHVNAVAGPVLAAIQAADRSATAASRRSAWAEGLGQGLTTLACGAAALAAAVLAAPSVFSGAVEPATAAVVVLVQLALVEPYAAMATSVRQYPALRSVLQRISASGVLDNGEDVPGDEGLVPVATRAGGLPGIELDALAAAWPGGTAVFEDLSAVAEPGTWLAVTGASGSGKSTLLSVIMGFLPPLRGQVRVSGPVAWCPQEAHLFDSTIRGNLMLGMPEQPAEQERAVQERPAEQGRVELAETAMDQALAAVGLSSLLARLEQGLDTRIGPGGAFLSGGERQRLAVARTLMTGADVILLDEPTAHLDAEAGRKMLADLRRGLLGKTVVLVTHNPADLDPSDRLLTMGDRVQLPVLVNRSAGR